MAAALPSQVSAPALCQKQRRAALRKERRKRKRQALAQARDVGSTPEEEIKGEDDEDNSFGEKERQQLHEEWLERERLAQEEFRQKFEREEAARKRKEEEERMIKEEWEAQQCREQEEKDKKQQEKRDREKEQRAYSNLISHNKDEAVQKMLDEAENQLDNGGLWMNPEAPVIQNSENFGTERDVANCPFFLKTGACRFGDRCSRKHIYPTSSLTLMIRGMFRTFGMEESRRDDYDIDACLEHSEEDLQESFVEFYHDVLPEFRSVGKVLQFKVSCNYEPHLRGNVYVQFDTEEQCTEAFIKFNGRWYAGRQLHCEICPVTRWKNAICGLFDRQKCPKGKHCNFLHVFRNPGNEFWEADRDLHMSPDRSVRGSRREGWHSERHGDCLWRHRLSSRSPPRSERSHSKRGGDRQSGRERSRERRSSNHDREDERSSRSRYSARRRSRDRSSRGREQDRLRTRSKDRKHNNKDIEDAKKGDRSPSREKERNRQSRGKSPKKTEKNNKTDDNTHRHHKRVKKSKKKSKKHKKKKSALEGATSSGEAEGEMQDDYTGSPKEERHVTESLQKTLVDLGERFDIKQCSPEAQSENSSTESLTEPAKKSQTNNS